MKVHTRLKRVGFAASAAVCLSFIPTEAVTQTPSAFEYRVLAANKTSTMQKEMQEAGDAGFEYRGQTVFKSAFGGKEVVAILERIPDAKATSRYEYRLIATKKTSTMQKELGEAGAEGFGFVGMTVATTLVGGDEVVVRIHDKEGHVEWPIPATISSVGKI